jgi:hypothetical protein
MVSRSIRTKRYSHVDLSGATREPRIGLDPWLYRIQVMVYCNLSIRSWFLGQMCLVSESDVPGVELLMDKVPIRRSAC